MKQDRTNHEVRKITTLDIRGRKKGTPASEKLVTITAYDYTTARLIDELVDVVLVGDSLGNVIQGHPNTLSVTVDQMIYHSAAVARALKHAHLVVDLPFMSYQLGPRQALQNAGRLVAEGQAESVKLEGGVSVSRTVKRIVEAGIPVMGHIGLTPQSVHKMGGYKIQGRTEAGRQSILDDALALEDAGAYAIVLEGMPSELAEMITERIQIPTIGIGAGPSCDGQVLVSHDLLGMNPEFQPRFVKRFADLAGEIRKAVSEYAKEVQVGTFPDSTHGF